MQTFLPEADLRSIRLLDPKRLGNQVYREAKTILSGGWKNHPVAKMWSGYESALCQYALFGICELMRRGLYYPHWYLFFKKKKDEYGPIILPAWFGDERVHSSHRSALLFKNFEWYGKFNWSENPRGPDSKGRWSYFWPNSEKGN